jgi:Trk K+ transport system NAD-binding subunit
MSGVYYLVPMLVAVVASLLIIRAGAIALMMTGLNYDKAKFQALSAFTGTGFTTREAEQVVSNSRRRKIISWLMILGNVGVVTVIVTATSSFATARGLEVGLNVLVLIAGFGLIVVIARHAPFVRVWESFSRARLERFKIFDEDATVDEMLHIAEGYGVVRIRLLETSAFVGQHLSDINAGLGHSFVLGIERDREWIPTPRLTRKLMVDDRLVIYGKVEDLADHFSG